MEYTYKKLADVEALTEVPEGATVFAEVDGEVKRIPGSGLGGSDIKTAIIKSSDYDNALAGLQTAASLGDPVTYSCVNMTFEEAYQTMAAGEPLNAVGLVAGEGCMCIQGAVVFVGTAMTGSPLMMVALAFNGEMLAMLYWTADGLSTEAPSEAR